MTRGFIVDFEKFGCPEYVNNNQFVEVTVLFEIKLKLLNNDGAEYIETLQQF